MNKIKLYIHTQPNKMKQMVQKNGFSRKIDWEGERGSGGEGEQDRGDGEGEREYLKGFI